MFSWCHVDMTHLSLVVLVQAATFLWGKNMLNKKSITEKYFYVLSNVSGGTWSQRSSSHLSNDVCILNLGTETLFNFFLSPLSTNHHSPNINYYFSSQEWRQTSVSSFLFPPQNPLWMIHHSLLSTVHKGAQYVRCYFTESPIFLPIRWNKHINLKNPESAGHCFCFCLEISFRPKHYRNDKSWKTSDIMFHKLKN